jgi:hypothetical protein
MSESKKNHTPYREDSPLLAAGRFKPGVFLSVRHMTEITPGVKARHAARYGMTD